MRVGVSWLREYVDVPELSAGELEEAFVRVGLEVEEIVDLRATVAGPLLVGRVAAVTDLTGFKKPIRHTLVDVGEPEPRSIVCGATNFAEGDAVVVALPGAVLPGGFTIASRRTYGQLSDGMICSSRELGVGDDHSGIIVLSESAGAIGAPGTDARPVVGLDDTVVELNITPDRGYCFSVRGLARELSHSLGLPFRDPAEGPAARGRGVSASEPRRPGQIGAARGRGVSASEPRRPGQVSPAGGTSAPAYPITVEDTVGCDRFAARVVRGVDPAAPSPGWMRSRLHLAGVRSIGLAVDITNYLMLELGQPMHAFDLDRLRGPLVVRRARPGERLTTLDGVDRALDPEDMVICDTGPIRPGAGDRAGVPISLAAVMGGETSEVAPDTRNVLFEAAHWDPVMVARTARRHKLSSEAAKRWERGVDPALPLVALERAVALLTAHAGGATDGAVLDIDHVRARGPIAIDGQLPARTAGVPYPTPRAVALLTEVGCAVTVDGDTLTVQPPTWRPDLTDPADLVEEVVRLDGYDRVPSVLPVAPPGNGLTDGQRRRRTVARALAEAGYVEALTYPFLGAAALDALGLPADDPRRNAVRLINPLSDEEPAMRTTLLPPLLAALRRNLGRGVRDVALYEIGLVFRPANGSDGNGAAGSGDGAAPPRMGVADRPTDAELARAQAFVPEQPWHAAVVLAGDVEPAGWWGAGRPACWADAVEAARVVASAAGVPADQVAVRAAERAPWHPGRCAEVLVDGRPVGYAGELHPAAVTALELPKRTCAMELNLDALPRAGVAPAPRVATYPPALIDVALVVGAEVPAADVGRALVDGAGDLLEAVRLFDVYDNPAQVGEGRRSLAYKLTFRAPDRTLTVEEAVAARDAAVAEAADRFGAVLRGA